jgi:hypothetical protein
MDFQTKFIFFTCAFALYVGIYVFRIMPLLQEHNEFSENKFWLNPIYIFESTARYYDICKNKKLPLAWFHFYQINFILWCLLILIG